MQFFILNDQKGIVLHTGDYQSWKESVEATPLVGSTQVGGKAFITKFTGVAGYDTKGCFETIVIKDGCSEVLQKYDTWVSAEEGHVRQVAVAWGGVYSTYMTKVPEDKIKIVPNKDPVEKFEETMKYVFGAPTYYNPKSNDGSQEMLYPSSSSSETSESSSSEDVVDAVEVVEVDIPVATVDDEIAAAKDIMEKGNKLAKAISKKVDKIAKVEKNLAELKKQKVMSQTKPYNCAPWAMKTEWRAVGNGQMMVLEDICKCGIGHPNADWLKDQDISKQPWHSNHGCCGCCAQAKKLIKPKFNPAVYKPAPLQIKKDSNPDIPLLKKMIKYAKKKFEVALEDLNQTEKYATLEPGLEQEVKKKSALRNKLWHELEDLQVKLTNALKKDDVYLDKDDVDYDPEHDGFGEELKSTTPRLKTEGLAQPATK